MSQIHFGVRHRGEHTFYKCEFCPTRSFFHAEKDASNHIRSNHLDTSSQIRASPLFPTEMYSKNAPKVHRCKLCPAEYESETKYLMHLAMHFEPFKCQLCPKSYRVEYLLERHVRESHQSNQVCINWDVHISRSTCRTVHVKPHWDIVPTFPSGAAEDWPRLQHSI